MTGRRRSPRKLLMKQPAVPDLKTQIERNYAARQVEWNQQIDCEKPDWTYLLGLHLQMTEIERLAEALQEFV